MEMTIEYIACDKLQAYKNNAKKHPQNQIEQIKKSIQEFGMVDPIGIWGNQNTIVEGHGRLEACKQLGIKNVPVIRLDHLSDEERKAYGLAHNQTTLNSDFDIDMLKVELDDIKQIDMEMFGFDVDDIKSIPIDEDEEVNEEIEDIDIPKKTDIHHGQVYKLGNHRLMCGDSTDEAAIQKLTAGHEIDMIYTDPPYGMNLDTDYSGMVNKLGMANKGLRHGKKYEQGVVDDFEPKMIEVIMAIKTKETFLWGADYYSELLPNRNDGSWIVWDKRANSSDDIKADESSDKMFGSCFELCWSKKKHKRDIARVKWAGVFGVEQEFDKKRHHPTQKPILLSKWFIERYSKEKQSILDLFGGSGSTLLACEQLNRRCYMMEFDPIYVEVIIKRWEKCTGRKAELLEE